MRKMFLSIALVLMLTLGVGTAFAVNPQDPTATATATVGSGNTINGAGGTMSILSPSATGGAGGAGGNATGGNATGGNATATISPNAIKITNDVTIGGGILSKTLSPEANSSSKSKAEANSKSESKASADSLNINKNEGNKVDVDIKNERAYLGAPSTAPAELNFGNGKVDWNFAKLLPKIGIPLYNDEEITEVVDTTANVPIKKLLPTGLKMKAAQMPLGYNVRLIVVKAEAQKTWNSGGSLNGAGSYAGSVGSAGSASFIPSVGGTKAHDLYTIMLVKVVVNK